MFLEIFFLEKRNYFVNWQLSIIWERTVERWDKKSAQEKLTS